MNVEGLIEELSIKKSLLDDKKQQTHYKIKYVVAYVKQWLFVNTSRDVISDLNFIDCMCNAGLYLDGELCTSIEVLQLFIESSKLHPDKRFHLYLNDIKKSRIESIKKVVNYFLSFQTTDNLYIHYTCSDVNTYLDLFQFQHSGKDMMATILFVDPYSFGTVIINNLKKFILQFYCEVIFNFFTSDYTRNGIDDRIKICIGEENAKKVHNKDDLFRLITGTIKVGYIKYVFSYQFKTEKNNELYQIIFATPNLKGLDKLKDALWEVFNGKFNHRNFREDESQLCFFTSKDEEQQLLSVHANEAKHLLLNNFKGMTVSYKLISDYLIEHTMLKSSQFINNVIKPLIIDGMIKKCGNVKISSNYKGDDYCFLKE